MGDLERGNEESPNRRRAGEQALEGWEGKVEKRRGQGCGHGWGWGSQQVFIEHSLCNLVGDQRSQDTNSGCN